MYKYVRLAREKKSKIERGRGGSGKREKETGTFGNNPATDAFTPHSMLYQTPHPLLFQFHPLNSSSSSSSSSISTLLRLATTPPSLSLSSNPSLLKGGETEMECVEAALKTSSRKDMAMKFSPQAFIEELSAFNVQNGAPCDDFFVDELLDFSHVEQQEEEEEEEQQQQQQEEQQQGPQQHKEGDSACVSPYQTHEICNPATTHYYANDDFASVPTSDLSVPDDVADLEWLSHFVEDSFSEFSAPIPTVTTTSGNPKQPAPEKPDPSSPVPTTQPCFKTPVPAKARSKRSRTGVRVWPLGSPSFTTDSSSSSTTTTTTTTTTSSSSSSPSSPLLIYSTNLTQSLDQVCSEAPAKKPKKKPSSENGAPRRCSHCGVQRTPQWRTGPLGAKTLCNACGVRYKSGRLLPEYRPACSPTFSSELHSNHHRKVLEMRRQKEMMGGVETGLAPPPVVPSF